MIRFRLDNKKVFTKGFSLLRERLKNRYYTSVSVFSADFGAVFSKTIGLPVAADNAEIQAHVAGEALAKELVSEVKSKKALAKRIIKYVQGSLEDAMRKESELCQRPYERELRDLDLLLENSTRSRRDSLVEFSNEGVSENEKESQKSLDGLSSRAQSKDKVALPQNTSSASSQAIAITNGSAKRAAGHRFTPDGPGAAAVNGGSIRQALIETEGSANTLDFMSTSDPRQENQEPQTPSPGPFSQSQPLSHGGVPWYMEPFDPDGTTVHDERWTGRELVRGMSEELSDMDEDELSGLVDGEKQGAEDDALRVEAAAKTAARRKAAAARRKRNRGW